MCEVKPATDEEMDAFLLALGETVDVRPYLVAWRYGRASDREKIAALEAEEKAGLRALNAEMLAALRDLVAAALTDSDACSICLHGTPGHLSGCTKASAEALIAKAEGKAR